MLENTGAAALTGVPSAASRARVVARASGAAFGMSVSKDGR
jgi:hypothetical protein